MTLSYDDTKPASSTLAASAEVRGNFQALRSLQGHNLLDDPYPIIWPAGDAADPAHWATAGAGVAIAREVTTTKVGAMCAKVTSAAATATYEQELLSTSSYQEWLDGVEFSAGAWVYADDASTVRIYLDDGMTKTYSDDHAGTSAWVWLTLTKQIADSVTDPATKLAFGLEIDASSKVARITGCTVVLGAVKPAYFIPPDIAEGAVCWSDYITAAAGVATTHWIWNPGAPLIVQSVEVAAATAPVGAALIADVNHWDGSAYESMFSTKPTIADGAYAGEAIPDGTYRYRCFAAQHGATLTDARMAADVDQIGSGTAGAGLQVNARCLQFASKINQFRAYNEHGK